ncbi:UMP kinase [Candidatus Gracilibacteria bacterium]|nr:UMP kinase [Candidatus Gracilibacteria bacterium]
MRILIKISGEALSNHTGNNYDFDYLQKIGKEIQELQKTHQIAIVCGGGNICRGAEFSKNGISPTVGHEVGMMATTMNALILADVIEKLGGKTIVYTARDLSGIGEIFDAKKVKNSLDTGKIAFLSGGTGHPYFSTDTASVLRSLELSCEMMIKCTSVDGIYSADPKKDPTAQKLSTVTYSDILTKNLRIMDQASIALARDHELKIGVCHIDTLSSLSNLAKGIFEGSTIQK